MADGLDIGHLIGFVELDDTGVTEGAGKITDKLKGLANDGKGLGALVGLGAGAAIAAGLAGAMDAEPAKAKLTAQLDLTAAESRRIGGVAGSLYSHAYGENLEEVNDALRALVQNVDGMGEASSETLERMGGKVLAVSDTFDQDLGGVTRAIGTMLRTGLAKDADQALDVLTKGFQNGTNVADDLLDTFAEYSTQFRKLGLDGPQAMGLLSQGLKGGARDADTVADALKELSIRAVDGSDTTRQGFEDLGLSADTMAEAFGKGGKSANEALGLTLDRVRAIKDPVAQSQAAVALFGTKAEDLGLALNSLDTRTAVKELGNVDGAAQRVADTTGGTAVAQFTAFGRTLKTFATDTVGSTVLPIVTKIGSTLLTVVTPPLKVLGDVVGTVADAFDSLPGPIQTTTVVLAGLVAFRGPVSDAFGAVKNVAADALDSIQLRGMYAKEALSEGAGLTGAVRSFATAGETAAKGGIGLLSGALGGPLGIAIAGATVAIPVLSSLFGANSATADAAAHANADLAAAIEATGGAIDDSVRKGAAKALQDAHLMELADQYGVSSSTLVDAILGEGDALKTVEDAIDGQIDALKRQDAALDTSTVAGQQQHIVLQGQIEAMEGQKSALEGLSTTTQQAVGDQQDIADAVDGSGTQADETARSVEDLEKSYDALKDAVDRYLGVNMDADTAQLHVLDGLDKLNKATDEHVANLDRTTQGSRDAESAILDQFSAIGDLTSAVYKQTGSADQAKAAWDREVGALRAKLEALGYNSTAIDALIGRYGQIPPEVFTNVGTNAGTAIGTIDALQTKLATLTRGTYYVDVYTTTSGGRNLGKGYSATGDLYSFYADGGLYDERAGRDLVPMAANVAAVVPANTWRVVGDRAFGDEFYLPDDDEPRTMALGEEWARRRGLSLVPLARYADGGTFPGTAAPMPATSSSSSSSRREAPLVEFSGPVTLADQRDAQALAEAVDWRRRQRGRRRS